MYLRIGAPECVPRYGTLRPPLHAMRSPGTLRAGLLGGLGVVGVAGVVGVVGVVAVAGVAGVAGVVGVVGVVRVVVVQPGDREPTS